MNESKKGVIQKVWQNEKKNSDQTFVWILWSKLSSKFLISSFIWVEQIQCTQRLIISRQFSCVCVWSNQFIVSMNKTNSINLCAIKILPLQDTSSRHQFLKFFKGKYFSRGSLNIFEIWCFEKYWRTGPKKKKKKKIQQKKTSSLLFTAFANIKKISVEIREIWWWSYSIAKIAMRKSELFYNHYYHYYRCYHKYWDLFLGFMAKLWVSCNSPI